MNCNFCEGSGRVGRIRMGGDSDSYITVVDVVTCPRCVRGVSVLGTHEMLRGADGIHRPGERLDGPTGTILTGLIHIEPGEIEGSILGEVLKELA